MAELGMDMGLDSGAASNSTDACHDGAAAPRILLVIPCFNEEASIGNLLGEIAATGRRYHTLVVDDGSSDATSAVAACRSPVARLAHNLGIGGAVQTGTNTRRVRISISASRSTATASTIRAPSRRC